MGLWLEHRDNEGSLLSSGRFRDGAVDMGDGAVFTIDQARQLARHSTHLPLRRRDRVLRFQSRADDLGRERPDQNEPSR
jgi:hypothetical protein